MKITCQACQAKYTIADEKVVGKVVKIRCKKCGASIVVNGNQTSPDASQPTTSGGVFDLGPQGTAASAWTVNVADGDQRTMTEAEFVAAYAAGVVTGETFCWKEGMADWLPMQEIAPLLAVCNKARPAGSLQEDDAPTRIGDPSMDPAGAGVADASPAMAASDRKGGNGLHVASRPPAAPVAARRAGVRGAVADLFGSVAQAGGEDEVLTSAPPGIPQAHGDAQKVTGARNESSVLFAVQERGNAAAPPSMVGTSEASGLIDIRQLSAQMHASADDSSKKKSRVDDIMNLGGGTFGASLAAPILAAPSLEQYSQPPPSMVGVTGSEAPPPKSKALAFLAVSAGLFFLIATATVVMWLVRGKVPLSVDEGTAASTREQVPMASASGAPTQSPSTRTATEAPQASVAPEAKASAAPTTAGSAPKETPTKEAKESVPAPTKEPKAAATPPKETSPPTGAPATEFNMGEARSRLASIAGGVQSCKRGETSGSGKVEIVFAPSGAVQSANLIPGSPFDGAPTGKCVEARFRGAHVPAFGGSPFTVTKSFSIN